MRNLDTASLRALVAIADTGGVTKAAALLNTTQSAVSMQIKRLEAALDCALLQRSGRGIAISADGQQMVEFARQIISLNDRAVGEIANRKFKGKITLGAPHDIVMPVVPRVLKAFADAFPRVQIELIGTWTTDLLARFEKGEIDMILTTEQDCGATGEKLIDLPLVWSGARDSTAWRKSPLPVAFSCHCVFWPAVRKELERKNIPWEQVVLSASEQTIEAMVMADLAVHVLPQGSAVWGMMPIDHQKALPELPAFQVNLYRHPKRSDRISDTLAGLLWDHYTEFSLREHGAHRKLNTRKTKAIS